MTDEWFVLVESNTTGSGRLFCTCARSLGLRPVVLARDPARYPYIASDEIETLVVDTTDALAVRAACAGLGGPVAGVTSSSEYFVGIASEIARELGRPHPDAEAIRACRDKFRQRVLLRDAGVACPAFAAARTPDEAVDAARRLGLPVVVKPVAGSGSIGVRLCRSTPQVRDAASAILDVDAAALSLPPQEAVVVEEFLDGAEFSVETFDDEVIGITRKHLGEPPYFVEIGHDFPAALEPARSDAIAEMAVAALRALGLGWGPAHVELRHTAQGPCIVEVNPRLAGGMIPRMVEAATGIDMIFHTVAKVAGRASPRRATRDHAASIRFLVAESSGRLVDVSGVEQARALPGIVDVGLNRAVGQDVVLAHSFQDRLGYVIAASGDPDLAARAATDALSTLRANIAPASSTPAGSDERSRAGAA